MRGANTHMRLSLSLSLSLPPSLARAHTHTHTHTHDAQLKYMPFRDNMANINNFQSSMTNALTIAMVSFKIILPEVTPPSWLSDGLMMLVLTYGTAANAFGAIVDPISSLLGLLAVIPVPSASALGAIPAAVAGATWGFVNKKLQAIARVRAANRAKAELAKEQAKLKENAEKLEGKDVEAAAADTASDDVGKGGNAAPDDVEAVNGSASVQAVGEGMLAMGAMGVVATSAPGGIVIEKGSKQRLPTPLLMEETAKVSARRARATACATRMQMDLELLWTDIVPLMSKDMEDGVKSMMISQVSTAISGDRDKVHVIGITWPDPDRSPHNGQNGSAGASGTVRMHLALEEGVCGKGKGRSAVEVAQELELQSREGSSRLKQGKMTQHVTRCQTLLKRSELHTIASLVYVPPKPFDPTLITPLPAAGPAATEAAEEDAGKDKEDVGVKQLRAVIATLEKRGV